MKKGSVAEELAERFDLPQEAVAGVPKVTISGRRRVLVENHKGLLGYGRELIDVNGGRVLLRIRGEELELRAMDREALIVTGNIFSVEFE